jgi:hypothetical protein
MPLAEPAAVSPDGLHIVVVVRRAGLRRLVIMSADGTNVRTLAPSIEIQYAGQAADWSPDGSWIVAGAWTPMDRPSSKSRQMAEIVRILSGQAVNPAVAGRKPDCVRGPLVWPDCAHMGATDGTSVDLPAVHCRRLSLPARW